MASGPFAATRVRLRFGGGLPRALRSCGAGPSPVRAWEQERYGRSWTDEEIALGLVGDVGDLMKLVQGKAGVRPRPDLDEALEHELADCLWAVMTLANAYGVDLQAAFLSTMDHLERTLVDRTGTRVHVVVGVLVEGDRLLLGLRSRSRRWYPGAWDLPGGHVEPTESGREALERELREELDVGVVVASKMESIELDDVVLDVWAVHEWTDVPMNRATAEHDELRWFSAEELPVATLAHPGLEAVLRRALATVAGPPG